MTPVDLILCAHINRLTDAELLRLLDLFLPRINFGQPVGDVPAGAATDPTGFSYLKRDLVRLLGILVHRNKEVQDRVRLCGGIPVVMNLCVVDERNPCTSFFQFAGCSDEWTDRTNAIRFEGACYFDAA